MSLPLSFNKHIFCKRKMGAYVYCCKQQLLRLASSNSGQQLLTLELPASSSNCCCLLLLLGEAATVRQGGEPIYIHNKIYIQFKTVNSIYSQHIYVHFTETVTCICCTLIIKIMCIHSKHCIYSQEPCIIRTETENTTFKSYFQLPTSPR